MQTVALNARFEVKMTQTPFFLGNEQLLNVSSAAGDTVGVATLSDGDIIAAWGSTGRLIAPDAAISVEFPEFGNVPQYTIGVGSVSALTNDDFVIAGFGDQGTFVTGINAQAFSAIGAPLGNVIDVITNSQADEGIEGPSFSNGPS